VETATQMLHRLTSYQPGREWDEAVDAPRIVVPALLGERLDGLLFTCVGVPLYPNAPADPPGAPSHVRRVTPVQ
jgi:hypothetical protein